MTMLREGLFENGQLNGYGRLIDGVSQYLFAGIFNKNLKTSIFFEQLEHNVKRKS